MSHQGLDLCPGSLVYMFCHLFGEDWQEKDIDPLFGRIPIDARPVHAPMADDVRLTEKSVAEKVCLATFIWLHGDACVEFAVQEERGFNFEVYDQVFCRRVRPLPASPIADRFSVVFDTEEASLLSRRKKRAAQEGVSCGRLVGGFRKRRWLRCDPYRFVCDSIRRHLILHELYRVEPDRVWGPILWPRPMPDREKMAPYEVPARAVKADIERFAAHQPELYAVLEDNVTRSLLKIRCDEAYMNAREAADGGGEPPI